MERPEGWIFWISFQIFQFFFFFLKWKILETVQKTSNLCSLGWPELTKHGFCYLKEAKRNICENPLDSTFYFFVKYFYLVEEIPKTR